MSKIYDNVEDILAHTGDDYSEFHGAVVPPIYQNSLFVQATPGNGVNPHPFIYTRTTNPTVEVAEKKLAALEQGGDALCFSSGMAAISSAIMYYLEQNCHVITLKSIYNPTRTLLKEYFPKKFGVTTSFLSAEEMEHIEDFITDKTRLIYLESPSTAVYRVQDLEKIAQLGKKYNIGTVIDNTYATPLYQHPLEFGIDISVHTASKYLGGHSDIIAGALISSEQICREIRLGERANFGGCIDPHQAWLLIRGMRTLKLRLQQHAMNAEIVAAYLKGHPCVQEVYYPGLKEHPQRQLIDKQMTGFNGLLSFVIKGDAAAGEKFINSLTCFLKGCSWGGFESLVISFTVGTTQEYCEEVDCPPNLIRLHIGIENPQTLIQDLEQAFQKMSE